MNRLTDAPYIQAAERFGVEEPADCCPLCGAVCEEVYHYSDGRPVGCNVCGNFMLSWGLFASLREEQ